MEIRPHENGYALLYYAAARQWLEFSQPAQIISAFELKDVMPALRRVEAFVAEGYCSAGFVAYEAAPAFDAALQVRPAVDGLPLLYFGIYRGFRTVALPEASWGGIEWQPAVSESEYAAALHRIRRHLRRGDTYQVNYTMRLHGLLSDDPLDVFFAGQKRAAAGYAGYLDCGSRTFCSFSPELFFELDGELLTARPMKGTAPRGATAVRDAELAARLEMSEKDRAENLMIVDMLRNDLGRVAIPGSVAVPRLFAVERYPTLYQLTSTVTARTDKTFGEIFTALFPCASITGAPKVNTMAIIAELENAPRGIYTGTMGFLLPGRQAQFNVAIRTMTVDRLTGRAEYGAGGGIVWDSVIEDEYAECLLKTRVVAASAPKNGLP